MGYRWSVHLLTLLHQQNHLKRSDVMQELAPHRKQGPGFLSRMGETMRAMANSVRGLRNKLEEFADMQEYVEDFGTKISSVDKVTQRIIKEQRGTSCRGDGRENGSKWKASLFCLVGRVPPPLITKISDIKSQSNNMITKVLFTSVLDTLCYRVKLLGLSFKFLKYLMNLKF